MNSRERFLATMNFEQADHVPKWELGYWVAAIRRWYGEGLPKRAGIPEGIPDGTMIKAEASRTSKKSPPEQDIHNMLQLDTGIGHLLVNNFFAPEFTSEVLEDDGHTIVTRDKWGLVERNLKSMGTLAHTIRGPVESREDWEMIKSERLQPTLDGRLPDNWEDLKVEYKNRDYPLLLGGSQGFYGSARRLLGAEPILVKVYDEPDLVHDIMDYLADFWSVLYDQVLMQTDCDIVMIWEDMCYKNGPLISPDMFREFMLKPYQKLTGVLRDHGVKVILTDTDGDCWKLIPLFLEGGVTGLYPFEAVANMDVAEVRKAFPALQMLGGIDKIKIAQGRDAVDEELERILPVIKTGGYIPFVDHYVPSSISWDNFYYYRSSLNNMLLESGSLNTATL